MPTSSQRTFAYPSVNRLQMMMIIMNMPTYSLVVFTHTQILIGCTSLLLLMMMMMKMMPTSSHRTFAYPNVNRLHKSGIDHTAARTTRTNTNTTTTTTTKPATTHLSQL